MKRTRRVLSGLAALALAACMAVPAAGGLTAGAASGGNNKVTIASGDGATHTYEAIQIFSGTYEQAAGDATHHELTGVEWGDGVDGDGLLTALKADNQLGNIFSDCSSANDVAEKLGHDEDSFGVATDENQITDTELLQHFADIVAQHLKDGNGEGEGAPVVTSGTVSGNVISDLPDGYYLIRDASNPGGAGGARTRFVLRVVGGGNLDVTAKSTSPSVDKQVKDDDEEDKTPAADAGNASNLNPDSDWHETADHAFYETFQFKLTASLPDNDELLKYDTYRLNFVDTMSKGVAFEGNVVLTIAGVTLPVPEHGAGADPPQAYYYTQEHGQNGDCGGTLNVTIVDVKALLEALKADGAVDNYPGAAGLPLADAPENIKGLQVVVTYDAYLDNHAALSGASGDTTSNENKVKLEYSNNPNAEGEGDWDEDHGETPEDSVWVFTYDTKTNKTDEDDKPLAGAKFQLRTNAGEEGSALSLVWDADLNAYRPAKEGEEGQKDIVTSGEDGNLNFAGLDAGTYYWVETEAPAGYNGLEEPFTVNIELDAAKGHQESLAESVSSNSVTFAENAALGAETPNQIINQKGAVLPGTGGIGTTIFYVVGGMLVVGAGVLLIARKRTQKEEQ